MRALLTMPFTVVRRFLAHRGFLLAAALSFSLLVCLAPLVLLLFSVAGFILTSDQVTEYVLVSATYLFPGSGEEVARVLTLLTHERRVTGMLGAGGLLLAASQLFSLLRTVMNTVFEVPRRRGLVRGFALDLFFVGILGLVTAVLATAILAVLTAAEIGRHVLPGLPIGAWIEVAAVGLMYGALLVLLFLVYRTSPNVAVPVSSALVATIVVAALWEIARWFVTTHLADFAHYGRLYGSLGVVVAALVWIYYSAAIFVLGAELAAVLTASAARGRGGAIAQAPSSR